MVEEKRRVLILKQKVFSGNICVGTVFDETRVIIVGHPEDVDKIANGVITFAKLNYYTVEEEEDC
jgi:hypothetical protein